MSNSTLTFYRLTLIILSLCGIVKMNSGFEFGFDNKGSTSTSIKIRAYYPEKKTTILSLLYFSEGLQEKEIDTPKPDKNGFYTLTDLLPCTTYQIEAELNDKYGQPFVHSENKTTKRDRPKTDIVYITSDSSLAVVWLEFNHFTCIDWLEVDLNRTKSIFFNKLNLTIPFAYIFYGLDPCSSYEISIKTHFTNNWNNKNHTDTSEMFRTKSVKIGGVENIHFDNKSNLLTWERPKEGANCIKGYEVQTKKDSGKITILTDFENLTLTEGCSNYSIVITPKGENVGEHRQYQLISGFKEPDPVENLYVTDSGSTQFTIIWSSPNNQPKCVKQYKILVNDVSDLVDSYTGAYTKTGLEPCTLYNISVCVVAIKHQDGKCKEIESTTLIDFPKEVNGLTYKYDGNSLIVSWNTPRYGANCVKEYNVSLYDIKLEKEVYTKMVQYSPLYIHKILRPCQMHMLYVTPVNSDGMNGAFNSLKFISRPTNQGRPSEPKMIARTATSLTLTSKYENLNDQCVLTFAYFKCRTVIGWSKTKYYWGNITLHQNQKEFNVQINGLTDLTNYSCSVRIANSNFLSDESMPIEFETAEKLADPLQVKSESSKSNSFILKWEKPPDTIRLKQYHVIVTKVEKNYVVPDYCIGIPYNKSWSFPPNSLNNEISKLEPYTKYSVQMAIENSAGIGPYSNPIEVITALDKPDPVENLYVTDRGSTQFTIIWSSPNNQPKCVKQYKILVNDVNDIVDSYSGTYTKRELEPCTAYNISVCVVTINHQDGKCKEIEVTTTMDIPKEVNGLIYKYDGNSLIVSWNTPRYGANCVKEYNVSLYDIKLEKEVYNKIVQYSELHIDKILRPCQMHKLFITPVNLNGTNGAINSKKFLSRPTKPGRPSEPKMLARTATSLTLTSKYENSDDQCVLKFAYFTCRKSIGFLIYKKNIALDQNQKEFTVKFDGLKDLTNYSCSVRIANTDFESDESVISVYATDGNFLNPLSVTIVVGCALGFLVFVILTVFVVYTLKSRAPPLQTTNHMKLAKFENFNTNIDVNLIVKEYVAIDDGDLSKFSMHEAKQYPEKNRSVFILPYDHNRVVLKPNIYLNCEYINASYIDGYKRLREYIATQGPTPETCYDFWIMVLQTNCRKIVMLTKLEENNVQACFKYYPDANKEIQFNDIHILSVIEVKFDTFIRRELRIVKGSTKRVVVQYHFQEWRDQNIHNFEMDLIEFIRHIKTEHVSKRVIIVHCSTGVGRTGTFIALDILMQYVRYKKCISVQEIVKKLRNQRNRMVNNFELYLLLHLGFEVCQHMLEI